MPSRLCPQGCAMLRRIPAKLGAMTQRAFDGGESVSVRPEEQKSALPWRPLPIPADGCHGGRWPSDAPKSGISRYLKSLFVCASKGQGATRFSPPKGKRTPPKGKRHRQQKAGGKWLPTPPPEKGWGLSAGASPSADRWWLLPPPEWRGGHVRQQGGDCDRQQRGGRDRQHRGGQVRHRRGGRDRQ